MAQRDTVNFREVTQVVVEDKSSLLTAGAEIGSEIMRQGQEARINENMSKAQLDLNALQTKYQIDNENDPFGGMESYKQQREAIFQQYGDQISPLYRRVWNESARDITTRNDATQQGWALKQTRINTVRSINASMKNNFLQANIDGQNFGNSDSSEIDAFVNFETSKQQLAGWGNKNLGEGTTADLLDGYDKDYMKSFISGVADSNPRKAAMLLESESVKKMFSTDEIDTFENVIKKNVKRKEIGSLFMEMENEDKVTEIVMDEEGDYFSKRLEIDTLEMEGKISPTTAQRARRVLTSQKNVDAVTNSDTMAEIVTQMYDLNTIADTNSEDYLKGVQAVRNDILEKQSRGDLTPDDAKKLNSQLRTLTGARTAEATQNVAGAFYESNQRFEQLPAQYRGKATRELFYRTEGKELTPEQMNIEATKVIDEINGGIRAKTVKKLQVINTPDADFLKTKGYTMDDVKETADKYGITEAEVIQKLKAKQ